MRRGGKPPALILAHFNSKRCDYERYARGTKRSVLMYFNSKRCDYEFE